MNTRARTIASFFSVAMAAMLLGAVVTTQIQRPETALARTTEPALAQSAPTVPRHTGPITLDTFRDVARLQTPGVVNVNTTKKVSGARSRGGQDPFRDFFGDDLMERFFGPQGGGQDNRTQRSLGSGFVVDKDGYVLTNRHVIEGADKISVTMADGKTYDARLVGKDARTDVALLKIEPKGNLTVLNLGDSDQTEVGEWVMAVGNPFGLSGNSVTVGVVSFKGRPLPLGTQANPVEMIQTDAAINPGNSGGPLLNTRGEVIGINTLIITGGTPASSGVGFAVPINVAKEILPQLRDKGHVTRGWLGVVIQPVSDDMAKTLHMDEAKGALIADVTKDSPAEKAGLKPDDVVVTADGRAIEDSAALSRYIASKAPGTSVRLQVLRAGAQRTVSLTLGTFPDEADRDETSPTRGEKLGMTLHDLTPGAAEQLQLPRGTKGVVVMGVEGGEAAEDAGLQRGDVIVSVNGEDVEDVAAFDKAIEKAKSDGLARLRVRRGNAHQFLILKLG
jgi:serine protease Do